MPLYKYDYLEVTCLEPKRFRVDQMREAVEYLKEAAGNGSHRLSAVTSYKNEKPKFWLGAKPFIHLKDITGLTPNKIWKIFDVEARRQVRCLEHRFAGTSSP